MITPTDAPTRGIGDALTITAHHVTTNPYAGYASTYKTMITAIVVVGVALILVLDRRLRSKSKGRRKNDTGTIAWLKSRVNDIPIFGEKT